ncbi:Any1 protein [Saccharomycopsis crataegensis]|uniref:Any1 protein n=1 Tax=Saccharomycopsis crataegensis TaxID=43959 RepID=A0AAV5QTF2_9ASCO|nr:Any1 protein [Saccharomycopsis crataegensis]
MNNTSSTILSKKSLGEISPTIDEYTAYYIPDWLTIQFLVNTCISFAPLFSYGSTVWSIEKNKSTLGFSIDICCTMIVSSILRINFYFVEPFELTLLRQSIIMIFIHIILLKVSLKYKLKNYTVKNLHQYTSTIDEIRSYLYDINNERSSRNPVLLIFEIFMIVFKNFIKFFDPYYKRSFEFWQWNEESKYWWFLGKFYVVNLIMTLIFKNSKLYGNLIGSASLLIESLLPLPQILLMNRLKSINGFKTVLLLSWYCGDLTKITYLLFGAKGTSFLFVFFGLFQMFLDVIIGFQYVYYGHYYTVDYMQPDIEMQEKPRRSIELVDATNQSSS